MPSVFTLSGSGRRKKRRKRSGGLAGTFKRCPTSPVSLRRVRLDRGGYDEDGRYWGANVGGRVGDLYAVSGYDIDGTEHLRAHSRTSAKAKLQAECPGIRFKR